MLQSANNILVFLPFLHLPICHRWESNIPTQTRVTLSIFPSILPDSLPPSLCCFASDKQLKEHKIAMPSSLGWRWIFYHILPRDVPWHLYYLACLVKFLCFANWCWLCYLVIDYRKRIKFYESKSQHSSERDRLLYSICWLGFLS